jgi:NADH dehydrogenase [ubiquinone] 1 alpha subcomplex assembly factor 7
MVDILLIKDIAHAFGQTVSNFKALASSIDTIYMVEASKHLREAQHRLLCGNALLEEIDIGFQSKSKYAGGQKVVWCEDMKFVPKGKNSTPKSEYTSTYRADGIE